MCIEKNLNCPESLRYNIAWERPHVKNGSTVFVAKRFLDWPVWPGLHRSVEVIPLLVSSIQWKCLLYHTNPKCYDSLLATSISFLPSWPVGKYMNIQRKIKIKETLPEHVQTARCLLHLIWWKTLIWTPRFHCFHHYLCLWSYKCYIWQLNYPAISKIPF